MMPFQSEKQRGWMWANEPEIAENWEKEQKSDWFKVLRMSGAGTSTSGGTGALFNVSYGKHLAKNPQLNCICETCVGGGSCDAGET